MLWLPAGDPWRQVGPQGRCAAARDNLKKFMDHFDGSKCKCPAIIKKSIHEGYNSHGGHGTLCSSFQQGGGEIFWRIAAAALMEIWSPPVKPKKKKKKKSRQEAG